MRDVYGESVKKALVKEGWTITHDPLTLSYGGKDVYVDLGAERTIGAEKEGRKIAVEVKSFTGPSDVKDLRDAIGQYIMYRDLLAELEADRELFLAVSDDAFKTVFEQPFGRLFVARERVNVVVFDAEKECILRWETHGQRSTGA
ncbi:MAG: XisH family protein [Planctomycetes bacterium]|nr:XisH family protein [Planctomycetota bacterium]